MTADSPPSPGGYPPPPGGYPPPPGGISPTHPPPPGGVFPTHPPPPSRRRIWVLLLVVGLPLGLLGGAYFLYATGIGLPSATSNQGVLIRPPLPLGDTLVLRGVDGKAAAPLEGQWTILIPAGGNLSQALYVSRQAHAALGGDAPRVRRVFLGLGAPPPAEVRREVQRGNAHLRVYHAEERHWRTLLRRREMTRKAGDAQFFLVDPRGFLFMYYTRAQGGGELLKDLKFLLRYDRHTRS